MSKKIYGYAFLDMTKKNLKEVLAKYGVEDGRITKCGSMELCNQSVNLYHEASCYLICLG
jgi:hypothetical protein